MIFATKNDFNYACGGTLKIQDFYFLKELIYLHNFNCSF